MELSQSSINDSKSGILTEFNESKNLLVTFGGISQGIGIPVFEFFNSVKELDCDKIFIRDFHQGWYQKGVDDHIDSVQGLTDYLQQTIDKHNYQKVLFMGNSMGGYAAILFGNLLQVDQILAFAPQTFISSRMRLRHLDFRWKNQMKRIQSYKKEQPHYFNLKDFLNNDTRYIPTNIYYSPKHRLDRLHAENLKGMDNVTLHPIEKGGHAVVKTLRDNFTH